MATYPRASTICPACSQPVPSSGAHYVSAVGHLTHPDDAIEPYYYCTRPATVERHDRDERTVAREASG